MLTKTDENVPPVEFKTPTTTRFIDALSLNTPPSSKRRVGVIGRPLISKLPSEDVTPKRKTVSVYASARQLFSPSNEPGRLIGRKAERQQLNTFLSTAIDQKSGGCTYISGPPGTGKSALVHEVFESFRGPQDLKIATINCVGLKTSKEVYTLLVQELGYMLALGAKSDKSLLSEHFSTGKKTKGAMHLVMLDELDSLLDGDCDVLYSLFEWALRPSSSLALVGIANALDLTDRFLPRLKARNLKPQLLPFLPYTSSQIADIISKRLRALLPPDACSSKDFIPVVHPAAIQLCSKKVSSQTGDLRKAFNLVKRAIDLVERESLQAQAHDEHNSPSKRPLGEVTNSAELGASCPRKLPDLTLENAPRVTIAHIARLASAIFNNGTMSRLAGLNLQQKAVLCTLAMRDKMRDCRDAFSTPSKSCSQVPTVSDLFHKYTLFCKRNDGILQPLRNTEFRDVVASLETLGLVHEFAGRSAGLLTPSHTPSRHGSNLDARRIVSAVSEKELIDSLQGAGADLLRRLIHEP